MTATKCQKKRVRILIYKEAIVNPKKDNFFRLLKSHFLTKYVEIDMEFSMFNHDHTGVKFSRQMAKNEKKKNIRPQIYVHHFLQWSKFLKSSDQSFHVSTSLKGHVADAAMRNLSPSD